MANIRWTDDERVRVFNAYVKKLLADPSRQKNELFIEAQREVLRPERYRGFGSSYASNVYGALDNLTWFAKWNPELFPDLVLVHHDTKHDSRGYVTKLGYWDIRYKRHVEPATPAPEPQPQVIEVYEAPQASSTPAPSSYNAPTLTEMVLIEMRNILGAAAKQHDDRLQLVLDLMTERMARLEERMIERERNIIEAFKHAEEHKKEKPHVEKVKKPSVLLIGGLPSQAEEVRHKVPWVSVDCVKELSAITGKSYQLVLSWSRFVSHSHQDLAKKHYGKGVVVLNPSAGVTTVVDTIKHRIPQPKV